MKRVIRYISEIVFAFVLIFVSYFAWDRIDVEAYEKYITQYNYDDIALDIENEFSSLAYLSDEQSIDDTILYINNYQDRVYETDILLVLYGIDDNMLNEIFLSINGIKYSLNDLYISKKDNNYYFLITTLNLTEYEKTNCNLKILVDDNFDFNNFESFSYNIVEKIKG